jgi:hypothetical protein
VAMWGRRSLRLKISLASFIFCGSYGWYWRRSEILWVSNRVRVNYDAHCGNRNVASYWGKLVQITKSLFAVKNARQYGLLGQPERVWGVGFDDFGEAGV